MTPAEEWARIATRYAMRRLEGLRRAREQAERYPMSERAADRLSRVRESYDRALALAITARDEARDP